MLHARAARVYLQCSNLRLAWLSNASWAFSLALPLPRQKMRVNRKCAKKCSKPMRHDTSSYLQCHRVLCCQVHFNDPIVIVGNAVGLVGVDVVYRVVLNLW
jgi:hypothetical protein